MNARLLGILLIVTGLAGLASAFARLPALPATAWLFLVLGVVAALWARKPARNERGFRFAGTVLLGVAGLAGAGPLEHVVVPGVAAAAFLGVWARDPWRTWPLIAGGLLGSLTLWGVVDVFAPAWNPTPLLFLGFAVTFSALYLLPADRGGAKSWALRPALFFTVMTVVVNDPARNLPGWLLPVLLIAGGVTLLASVRRDP